MEKVNINMLDILITIYRNYSLLPLTISYLNKLTYKDWRLLICDNTPINERIVLPELGKNILVYVLDVNGIDGETHAAAVHFLLNKSKETNCDAKYVLIQDSDFFWMKLDIVEYVDSLFKDGYVCIGAAGFYRDWINNLDPRHPNRAGHLCPVLYGMFVDRELVMSESLSVSWSEAMEIKETGWRLREKIINNNLKRLTFQGEYYNDDLEQDQNIKNIGNDVCYFKNNDEYVGCHFLKGSGGRLGLTNYIPYFLENK